MNKYYITISCDTTFDMKSLLNHIEKEWDGKYYGIPKHVTIDPQKIIKVELISIE